MAVPRERRANAALADGDAAVLSAAWRSSPHESRAAALAAGELDAQRPENSRGFARLWTAFLSARVLIALAILGLHAGLHVLGRPLADWLLSACVAYLAATLALRLFARARAPGRDFDAMWLPTVGVDLLFFALLQLESHAVFNYTPLLALPVLMAAVLASRALALGTAALVTLMLLGSALWSTAEAGWASSTDVAQAGLTGAGLLALSLLTNQMAARLAREEATARRSGVEAHVQALVSGLVIESLADGVLVLDARLWVRTANPAAHLLLGADDDVMPTAFSLLDDPAWGELVRIARAAFADGRDANEAVTLHHEGRLASRLQVRTQRTPPIGEAGSSLCVMFLQDLRSIEARLRTEKLAAMGRMSAAVAHEIRNPLAAISQANALLDEELHAPAQRRLTAMVRQNSERLQHIVEDVLDVARVQESDAGGPPPVLALDADTRAFCEEWRQQHAARVRLRLELHGAGVHVQFAREHLRRIVVNLLDNAARYASAREGAIQVATHAVRHGPVMLLVWSDGAALEPGVQRHLFEPFFSSESRSSGLGLYICRELCERHGATIGYERTAREQSGRIVQGNEFFLSLRRAGGAGGGHSTFGLFRDSTFDAPT